MAIVPPGGFAGYAQMAPASKAAWRTISRTVMRRKRKTRSASSSKPRKRKSNGRLPKFGSKAWRKKFKLDKR